ncbi:hypothetical protein ACHAWF_017234 [Thalassiosira exigua]
MTMATTATTTARVPAPRPPSRAIRALVGAAVACVVLLAAASSDAAEADEDALASRDRHHARRRAAEAAFGAAFGGAFDGGASESSSPEEVRARYYLHAGTAAAARNARKLAGTATTGGDGAEDDDDEATLDYLEGAIEAELRRVRRELRFLEAHGGGEEEGASDGASDGTSDAPGATEGGSDDEGDSGGAADSGDEYEGESDEGAESRLRETYRREYDRRSCAGRPTPTFEAARAKWREFRSRFWERATTDGKIPTDEGGYVPYPGLRVDHVDRSDGGAGEGGDEGAGEEADGDDEDGSSTTTTRALGLVASRSFAKGDVVYVQGSNRVHFPSEAAWTSYLRSFSDEADACLALEWSFMKQVSRPGRWTVGLVLDEGTFRWVEEGEGEGGGGGERGAGRRSGEGVSGAEGHRGGGGDPGARVRRGQEVVG